MGDNIECLTLNTIVNVVLSNGNKYVFNGLTNYDANKLYGLSIGNYVFQNISNNHPMALLNNDVSNLISYSGSILAGSRDVSGINYDFYHGDINVTVNGDFSGLSVYCFNHGYMGGENLLIYSDTCHKTTTTIQPSNALKCLSQQSRVNIITLNENINKYVFNNDLVYNPTLRYGLYDGTYVLQNIPQSHPMAILNYNISGVLTYTGDLSKNYIKTIDDISYNFYYGDITINVTGPFGTTSIACYNHENMRMDYIFTYNILCNDGAIISTAPVITYQFDNSNIIVSQQNSNNETNYFINYNNNLRPWKINTSYISHNNSNYQNELLKQNNDNIDYNFSIDSSKNNLRIESVDSNIDLFTHTTKDDVIHYINFQGQTNFNNNSYFNETSIFNKNIICHDIITAEKLTSHDICVNVLKISDNNFANIIGNIKIDGTLDVIGQIKDEDGNVVQGNLLNNYTIQNSKLNDSSLNNTNINNSLIGFTTPSQAKFTDVSINNLVIENNLKINNNLNLKNIEENGYIYATLNSNNSDSIYKIYNNEYYLNYVLFFIHNSDLTFELPNINTDPSQNERPLDETIKYRFYLEKNNNYYFNFFKEYNLNFQNYINNSNRAIGLYFNNESKIDIKYIINNASIDNYIIDNKNYYIIYHEDFSSNKSDISLNIKGNFEFSDLVLLNTGYNPFIIEKTFEKVFLYKHDINLIDKIEIVDNSINTLLTSDYDASFSNLNITNDISLNQKLFVGSDVSLNAKLFVKDDVSFNKKLFVEDDISSNSKLFVKDDVSFNSKLFVFDTLDVSGLVKLNNNLNSTSSNNGSLVVSGGVGIGENLNVGNNLVVTENTTINSNTGSIDSTTGALKVTGGVGIGENLNVGNNLVVTQNTTIKSNTGSIDSATGALKVTGGVGIGENLNVGNNLVVTQNANINSNTTSTNSGEGALIVTGGVGIGKELNVDGNVSLNSNVNITGNLNVLNKVNFKNNQTPNNQYSIQDQNFVVDGNVGIEEKLIVGNLVSFNSIEQSNDANNGALVVSGGVGIGLNLNVNGIVNFNNTTDSESSTTGSLIVDGGVGIVKKLNVDGDVSLNHNVDINNHLTVNGDVSLNHNVDINNHLTVNGDVSLNNNVNINNLLTTKNINSENILPKTNNTYNLGDSNNKWKQLFLDNSGINIGDSARIIKQSDGSIILNNTAGNFQIIGDLGITGNLTIPGENIQAGGQLISESHIINTPIGINISGETTTIGRKQALFSTLDVLNNSTFQNNITIYKDKKIKFANQPGSDTTNKINGEFDMIDVSSDSIFKSSLSISGELNVNSDVYLKNNVEITGNFTSTIQSVKSDSTLTPQNVFQPLVPPGAVMSFATKGAPQGWLECNGQILSRSDYQNLFDVIGTTWDNGVGSNQFRLPNLNGGYFIRGGTDVCGNLIPYTTAVPSNGGFSITTENNGSHNHDAGIQTGSVGHSESGPRLRYEQLQHDGRSAGVDIAYGGQHKHNVTVTGWDTETAPMHVILLYCIKY